MTIRERLTAVLRGCDQPATTQYLADALGDGSRLGRIKVWVTLRQMEFRGEVSGDRSAASASPPYTVVAWRLLP